MRQATSQGYDCGGGRLRSEGKQVSGGESRSVEERSRMSAAMDVEGVTGTCIREVLQRQGVSQALKSLRNGGKWGKPG